jgi:HlyD family secretion protein
MTGFLCAVPLLASLFSACAPPSPLATGYAEGDYVLIAPLDSAQIGKLAVGRGDRVVTGQPLVTMEQHDARLAVAEANAALTQAQSQLANLREGRRPEEIRVLEAALRSARAQATEADRARDRVASLAARGAATPAQRDDAQTGAEIAYARVAEAEATLSVARLPARPQEIAAAEAGAERARAARDAAQWRLDQRVVAAPASGTITDVIRQTGEMAGPGTPVLELLPDGGVKLRLYLPEGSFASVRTGMLLEVRCDGCPATLTARVTYIATGPEYTPPVIYSLENRQKLVYLIEARPEGDDHGLKPGQIVDVVAAGDRG